MQSIHWHLHECEKEVAQVAVSRICEVAKEAIRERGRFNLVLAGGKTPELTYSLLSQAYADWAQWHLFFGDERCLPVGTNGLNSQMLERTLTSQVPIPKAQIYPIPVQLGPEEAARVYANILESVVPFDLVLLGVGEDGHTASLFPGCRLPDVRTVVPISNAPKLPEQRVSLNVATLSDCRKLLFLVAGAQKSKAVSGWRRGEDLPASWIVPAGPIDVLIDYAAWGSGEFYGK